MKFTSKQLAKESQKAENEEKKEKLKVKAAIEKGVIEVARVYGENAIRKKNESLNYLKLSSKLDAVSSKLKSMQRTKEMTKSFQKIMPKMQQAMKSMDIDKIANTMDQFEQNFESLDIVEENINMSLGQTMATSTPQEQVDKLISQVADEYNIDISSNMPHQVQE